MNNSTLHEVDTIMKDSDVKVGKTQIKKMAEELVRRGVEPSELGRLSRMKMYQSITKDDEGEAHIHDLWGFHFDPKWSEGPDWPVVQPAQKVSLTKRATPKRSRSAGWARCAVAPDIQVGFLRTPDGMEPTHDPLAIELFLQLLEETTPETVVLLGDNLDLPEFGSYRKHPSFALTTQMTLDYMHGLCTRIREICGPDTKIKWLAGNHEERLSNFVIDNAAAAHGIKQANAPDSWPVMSVPHLLHLDDLEIQYLGGYPSNHFWLTPQLRFIHGNKVQSKGSTAHMYLNDEKVSVIYGHIHRLEQAYQTRTDYDGTATIMAASPGCLARLDGYVPSMKQGMDIDGRPIISAENWQQGMAVVDYHEDGRFDYKQIPIHSQTIDGNAWKWSEFEGVEYRYTGSYTISE